MCGSTSRTASQSGCQVKWRRPTRGRGGAHPEVVRGDGPDLGDLEHRGEPVADASSASSASARAAAAMQVFGLELGAGARGVVHPEMRHPLVPRPGDAELLGAGRRRHPADRVDRDGGARSRRTGPPAGSKPSPVDHAPLEPDLLEERPAPFGEQADAVGHGHDLVEVLDARASGRSS